MPRDSLKRYGQKRDFTLTPEPRGERVKRKGALGFVVQKHWASRLHYDFRLELQGTLKSWAVPKGPSLDPANRRLAVQVEDHPIAYAAFEGTIPPKQYGAGRVIVWDKGTWVPEGDPVRAYRAGHMKFRLVGHKLRGRWALVRMNRGDEQQVSWLLRKEKDGFARAEKDHSVVEEHPESVAALPMPDDDDAAAEAEAVSPPRALAGAKRAALPATLAPQLATLVDAPPPDVEAWRFELKFDGYRILARIDGPHGVRLFTRTGEDWTAKLPHIQKALAGMGLRPCWLDGEIVVPTPQGGTDFQALQNAFRTGGGRSREIVYVLFDLPCYDGQDLRGVRLAERRALLARLFAQPVEGIRFSPDIEAPPEEFLASACKAGLEGIIGKRQDSPYVSRRSPDWIKLKCSLRQEFVVGGYTPPQGSRTGFGALLVGVHDEDGALVFSGGVGTGFNDESLGTILQQLEALRTDERPFRNATGVERKARWVRPELVAELRFSGWTQDGKIRHPAFLALRADKPARQVARESPVAPPSPVQAAGRRTALPASLRVTHGEKTIDPASGARKIDLVHYYAQVAPLMMPGLKARPVAFVRAPRGVRGPQVFQRHLDAGQDIAGVRRLDPALWPGHDALLEVARPEALAHCAQLNIVEFHVWNMLRDALDKPDRMVFDLDPGEGVAWPAMQQAAQALRLFLGELGLHPFCKTSGGKGLHVVVPILRRHDWETVKGFSRAISQHLAQTLPSLFVAKSGPRNRVGRIFIDYLRNGFGASAICTWSLRARPGIGVSVPIAWDEVAQITGGAHWHLFNIDSRLALGNAPWEDYRRAATGLAAAMRRLGHRP